MTTISGTAYLIIGGLVSVYSKFVFVRTGSTTQFLNMFFYIGLFFVIIGLGKLGFKKIRQEQPPLKHAMGTPASIKHCKKCGNTLRSVDIYCNKCGTEANYPLRKA